MPFSNIRAGAAAAIFALCLSACGGGDGTSVVSGTVVDHNQAVVANAEVLAVDRLTGREFSTLSDKDGRYSFVLPNGHYDLGSDDGQQKAAHMVTLRSLSDSNATVDFALPADQVTTQLSGQVFIRDGIPAANYRLVFSSSQHVSEEDASLSKETTTDAHGHYVVSLGAQRLLDVDIYESNGEFVEFVVLHKLDGALRADITLGDASDDNRYRHDHSVAAHDGAAVRPANERINQAFQVTRKSLVETFTAYKIEHEYEFHFTGGILPPDGSYLRLDDTSPFIFLNSSGDTTKETTVAEGLEEDLSSPLLVRSLAPAELDVSVRKDGSWWYSYAIHFNVNYVGLNNSLYFTDETNDTYRKASSGARYFKLSYNSEAPNITQIKAIFDNLPREHESAAAF